MPEAERGAMFAEYMTFTEDIRKALDRLRRERIFAAKAPLPRGAGGRGRRPRRARRTPG
jgi:hypothetical protein